MQQGHPRHKQLSRALRVGVSGFYPTNNQTGAEMWAGKYTRFFTVTRVHK